MTEEPVVKEIAPELREFYCQTCFESIFVADIIKQQYRTVTITMDLLEPHEQDGVYWGILCEGRNDDNLYAKESKPHLAKFQIIRHKMVAVIPPVSENITETQ